MRRFILTGAPGAGKTTIIRALEAAGHGVVEEAATDVIALQQARGISEPWRHTGFVGSITDLQRARLTRASHLPDRMQFHDRSPICTHALATFIGHPIPSALSQEIERIQREAIYQRRVFLVRMQGFITPTEARRIGYEEALRFEQVHEETYSALGYECVPVGSGTADARMQAVLRAVGQMGHPGG